MLATGGIALACATVGCNAEVVPGATDSGSTAPPTAPPPATDDGGIPGDSAAADGRPSPANDAGLATAATLVVRVAPTSLVAFDGALYFAALTHSMPGAPRGQVWRSDGTTGGTAAVVTPLYPYNQAPFALTSASGALYFIGQIGADRFQVYRSHGSDASTVLLEMAGGSIYGAEPGELTPAGDLLFWRAVGATIGMELFREDGDQGRLVLDVAPGPTGSRLGHLTALGAIVMMVADDGTHGLELWRSDGTAAGTAMVSDVAPGAESAAPEALLAFAGNVFFTADDGVHGREPWRSDGTAAGTELLADVNPGRAPSDATTFAACGELVCFVAAGDLWVTDGTAAGTSPLRTISSAGIASPSELTAAGALAYFAADDGVHGREPWRTDGTAAGTELLADVNPGPASSDPAGFRFAAGRVYFAADDGAHGRELWGGDEAGAAITADLAPGPASSDPRDLTLVGPLLFLSADDGGGRGLWVVAPPSP